MPETLSCNWLVFSASSPEPKMLGSVSNVGAAVLDRLAEVHGADLQSQGPIQSTLVEINGRSVRLARPNVLPEMADDAVMLLKNKCKYGLNSVILIYADPDYLPGDVRVSRKGGSNAKVSSSFLRVFGKNDVVRVRVGVGKNSRNKSVNDAEGVFGQRLLTGINIAAPVIDTIIGDGYSAGVALATKLNRESRGRK